MDNDEKTPLTPAWVTWAVAKLRERKRAAAAAPPVSDRPVGTRALCIECNRQIVNVGPRWEHWGGQEPEHAAKPKEGSYFP